MELEIIIIILLVFILIIAFSGHAFVITRNPIINPIQPIPPPTPIVPHHHHIHVNPSPPPPIPPVPAPQPSIGGCSGTKYGCCPYSQAPKLNIIGSNCI